jgi:hypothetical protein
MTDKNVIRLKKIILQININDLIQKTCHNEVSIKTIKYHNLPTAR